VAALLLAVIVSRWDYFETVIRSRVQTGGGSTAVHLDVYDFVPDVLATKPLFGLGLNNFSVYYEAVTGKTNWGPHSFFVALFVETGLVGAALFAVFLVYLFALMAARRVGYALASRATSPPRDAARVGDDRGAGGNACVEPLLPDDVLFYVLFAALGSPPIAFAQPIA
jgi:hypothetical protein